ncbi:hypothetical protein PM082_006981 [Marasmius tenuissimus]|nr:hypothetical protein PM082_006981 [Marasmius tenuissimus]
MWRSSRLSVSVYAQRIQHAGLASVWYQYPMNPPHSRTTVSLVPFLGARTFRDSSSSRLGSLLPLSEHHLTLRCLFEPVIPDYYRFESTCTVRGSESHIQTPLCVTVRMTNVHNAHSSRS